jgi:transglutaminase-like putative cysteine protease
MRIRILIVLLFAFCLVIVPKQLLAQFQQPTQEELKLTADPKNPGAEAIYLYREETVDDNLHFHTLYVRIKVLTEKGKEQATVSVPYFKGETTITAIKARTIHADGTVIPLDVKPADLVAAKVGDLQVNRVVFTLPSVEVGSILEYRWDLRYDDGSLSEPFWRIQQPYSVRRAHYSFLPFKHLSDVTNEKGESASHLLFTYNLPDKDKVIQEASGKFSLDVVDVPPEPSEELMPPLDSQLERVVFYYTPYVSKEDYWKHVGGKWSGTMDHFAGESKTLKEAVDKLIAPGDTEEQKARKLYDAVMTVENTDYTREKSRAELKAQHIKRVTNAEGVWLEKTGSSDDIALLYLAMVRIAGLKAYAITLSNRDSEVFNPYYLSLNQVHDVLVGVMLNGKEIPVDPGKRYAPFGVLAWNHIESSGLQQSDHGPAFLSMPVNAFKDVVIRRMADVVVNKDDSVTGQIRISMTGLAATRWRELAVQDDEGEVKKQFTEEIQGEVPDGVSVEFDHFLGMQDYHAPLMAMLKISGGMGTVTGKRIFLPGAFFASRAKHPFTAEDRRLTPVNMEYAEVVADDVKFHLPEGLVAESVPAASSVPWPGFGAFDLKASPAKGEVAVSRVLVQNFAVLEARQYPALRDFYQKVATADQQQLVLVPAQAVAGNQ